MSSTYVPTPVLFVSITIPSDGDPETAASVNGPFEEIADGLAFISLPASASGNRYPMASQSFTRMQTSPSFGKPTEWSQIPGADAWVAVGATPVERTVSLKFPIGSELTDLLVYVKAGGGHSGLPGPGDRPTVQLFEYDSSTETLTAITTAVEDPTTSISIAAYEAAHAIPLSLSGVFPDPISKRYFLRLLTEGGVNAKVNFRFNGVGTTTTIDSVDPGGA